MRIAVPGSQCNYDHPALCRKRPTVLLGTAPDDENWQTIVDETSKLIDDAYANL